MFNGIVRSGLLALSATVGLATSAGAQTKTFVFTAIPDQDETRLVERFTKVADYLQQKLGVPVKYLPVKSYPAAVTAFTNDQVQLAWFGGFTGVQARRAVPGSEAIAQGDEDVAFKSYVIANAKTGLQPGKGFPKGIAGKSFTFGARASTSGRLMPEFFFRQGTGGKSPDELFSRVGFSGDHSGRRGRRVRYRLQGQAPRRDSGHRRSGGARLLRALEVHPGKERRLCADRGGREDKRPLQLTFAPSGDGGVVRAARRVGRLRGPAGARRH